MLFLRSTPKSEFVCQKKISEVDVEALNMYFNLAWASTQLMNGKVPWRGDWEKDSASMQILIEALTTHASVVFDATHLQVGLSLTQQPIILSLNVSQ